jgi:pimeloyl-ACP methyl ester carboxylesterase
MTLAYRTALVDELKVFYREAGDPKAPTVLLLHGFPTSSHMFRDLIPALADRYHVVAPDLPGFGFTDAPDRTRYSIIWLRWSSDSPRSLVSATMPFTSLTMARRSDSDWPCVIRSGSPL